MSIVKCIKRDNVSNLSSEDTYNINDKEILLKEYDHVNKSIEQKDDLKNKGYILIPSAIIVLTGFFSINEPSKEITIGGFLLFVITFILFVCSNFLDRADLIDRKKMIIKRVEELKNEVTNNE